MRINVNEQPITALAEYARIPIAFEVNRVLDVAVEGNGGTGFVLSELRIDTPYLKDYDVSSRQRI